MNYDILGLSSSEWKSILKKLEVHGEVIRKFSEGAKVQFKGHGDSVWKTTDFPIFQPHSKYRIKPEAPPLEIPWELIPSHFKFAAMGKNGRIYLYQKEPQFMDGCWACGGSNLQPLPLLNLNPRNVPWDQSLTARPEASKPE